MATTSDVPLICFPSSEKSFTRAFLEFIRKYGARFALIDPETKERLAFFDLDNILDQVRYHLHQRGIEKGTVVATHCGNSIDFILMCMAAIDLGAIIVPMNPASTLFEIEKYLIVCKVEHIVIEPEYLPKIKELLERPTFKKISIIPLEQLRGLQENEPVPPKIETDLHGDETAFIFFSSGTTGPPKAIRHSHRTLLAPLCQVMSTTLSPSKYPIPSLLGGNRVHGVLPYFHAGGLITVFCMLVEGVTVVINRKWNQLVFVGAAMCEESQIRSLKERLPDIQDVVQCRPSFCWLCSSGSKRRNLVFGMTEAGMLLFATPTGNTRLSSIGRPMPGVEAAVSYTSTIT
ncbi:hypothetical protein ANCDUO_06619 [Ancylostoma duodenale]|uniref:AMP-dependent synthetase/ligase domain-containing protein n=1 Tax=Ancylostoma duodenale TaxID=51022 RepID=A0A0C2D173_9BILA|nr:hypothetical protein ANCDUO_06619 [Ancylostoma duodenale]